ncbi:MAG: GntR family transcriptional regulator [Candidatus Competibacterales bacterium]
MSRTADKLVDVIRADILGGVLKPGDRLEENDLADRFSVSRTPVREALRTLTNNGLIEIRPRRGAYVRQLSASEIIEMFEVAAELEGMAGRLAAKATTKTQARAIESACQACRGAADANDAATYAALNEQFHTTIHVASGNSYLCKQLEVIEARLQIYRRLPFEVHGRLQVSAGEHEAITAAILSGADKDADDLLRDHMMLQGQRLPALLKIL